jgi:carbon-monoxide dehydrogenase small subunit
MDGRPVASCLALTYQARDREIVTVEGLAEPGGLDPIQRSFIEHGAIQCGYCTPGMIVSAKALLDRHPNPTVDQIKTAIAGNLCRCTGYQPIVRAIEAAGRERGSK